MLEIITFVAGLFIGWSIPQPAIITTLIDKIRTKFNV